MSDRQDLIRYNLSDFDDKTFELDLYEKYRPITVTEAKRTRPIFETTVELGTNGFKLGIKWGKETETHTKYELWK